MLTETRPMSMLATQGKYDAADVLYQRAIKIQETSLGLEHPDLARSLGNRAAMFVKQVRSSCHCREFGPNVALVCILCILCSSISTVVTSNEHSRTCWGRSSVVKNAKFLYVYHVLVFWFRRIGVVCSYYCGSDALHACHPHQGKRGWPILHQSH